MSDPLPSNAHHSSEGGEVEKRRPFLGIRVVLFATKFGLFADRVGYKMVGPEGGGRPHAESDYEYQIKSGLIRGGREVALTSDEGERITAF